MILKSFVLGDDRFEWFVLEEALIILGGVLALGSMHELRVVHHGLRLVQLDALSVVAVEQGGCGG